MKYFRDLMFLCGTSRRRLPYFLMLFLILAFFDLLGVGLVGGFVGLLNPDSEGKLTDFSRSFFHNEMPQDCLLYTSPSPRDATLSRMPSSA